MLQIRSLELQNIRCFGKKQHIDFTIDKNIAQWTVILGDNGTGKTSLLKSIVSLLPSPKEFSYRRSNTDTEYYLSYYTDWSKEWSIHRNGDTGPSVMSLEIEETERPFISFDNNPKQWVTYNDDRKHYPMVGVLNTVLFSPVYCFAYGANRRVAPKSLSGEKFLEANETLFIEDSFLQNSEELFFQLDYESAKSRRGSEEINRLKSLIIKVLPKGIKDIRVFKKGHLQREVQFETPYGWVGMKDLSMGYKTTIAWLMDFAYKMIFYHQGHSDPFNQPAILLIDEIDLHMHPSWQYEIIENLTKLFPKTQFIVTAHSPLIAQAALSANIVLLKRSGKEVEVVNDPDIIRSWRVDQILTSDLFGVKDVRPSEIKKLIRKRDNLLAKTSLSDEEQEKLEILRNKIGEIPFYNNKYEKQAFSAIDKIADILKNNQL